MEENKTLLTYAVVENGVITNILVFDNEKTAEEFGCFPLTPNQGIGDVYVSPEEFKEQQFENGIKNIINKV